MSIRFTPQVLLILLGPASVGLSIGLIHDDPTPAALLPLVLLGVTALMAPALYIASALAGVAPPVPELARAVGTALYGGSVALLGLAPALAFLAATSSDATWLGHCAFLAGGLVALRSLFVRAFGENARAALLYVPWAIVSIGVGARWVASSLAG